MTTRTREQAFQIQSDQVCLGNAKQIRGRGIGGSDAASA
jgi:hypothetical protein